LPRPAQPTFQSHLQGLGQTAACRQNIARLAHAALIEACAADDIVPKAEFAILTLAA